MVQDKVNNFNDFEKYFKDQYWNDIIQHSLQWKVTNGSFYTTGNLTRVQYATQILNAAHDLGMPNTSVLSYLPNHFERHVKPHLFNKTCEKEIMQILANFDADDKKYKARNNNNNNNKTQNDNTNSSNQGQQNKKFNPANNKNNQSQNRAPFPNRNNFNNTNNSNGRGTQRNQNNRSQETVDVNAIENYCEPEVTIINDAIAMATSSPNEEKN